MAIYRNIHLSFWTDSKVEDEFTPEDKFFYLYLLTNPQTNICGCYEVSYSQMSRQTGYNKETINRLIERFENVHDIIRYSKDTKEILILHWYKYNIHKSEKTLSGVENVAKFIKNENFKKYVFYVIDCVKNDTPCMGYETIIKRHTYPMQASVSDTVTVSDADSVSGSVPDPVSDRYKKEREDIINYLNLRCNTNYRPNSKDTKEKINARLSEGFSVDDFYMVIDKKANEWMGTEYEKFLTPETLFRPSKFEKYLNQNIVKPQQSTKKAQQKLEESREMMRKWAEQED